MGARFNLTYFCERPIYLENTNAEEIYFSPLRSQNICEAMSGPIKDEKHKIFSPMYIDSNA